MKKMNLPLLNTLQDKKKGCPAEALLPGQPHAHQAAGQTMGGRGFV